MYPRKIGFLDKKCDIVRDSLPSEVVHLIRKKKLS